MIGWPSKRIKRFVVSSVGGATRLANLRRKFSKTRNNFGAIMRVRDCDCAPVLRFFDAASDGATANREILDRIFGQFFYKFEAG